MTRTVSTQTKIRQLLALVGTKDVTAWESQFIADMEGFMPPGQVEALSDKQLEVIERIHSRHFA